VSFWHPERDEHPALCRNPSLARSQPTSALWFRGKKDTPHSNARLPLRESVRSEHRVPLLAGVGARDGKCLPRPQAVPLPVCSGIHIAERSAIQHCLRA